jgi:peptide-methionine (R)-S-oxide reductase
MGKKVKKTDAEWKKILPKEVYKSLRKKETEIPFTGKYNNLKEEGIYYCAGCGTPLFHSKTKYDSGTGWPAFYKPMDEHIIEEVLDKSLGIIRTEILCSVCGGHLGHVFNDGPPPTGLRYCVNSVSLEFKRTSEESKKEEED